MQVPESEIPENTLTVYEREHIRAVQQKQAEVDEARKLRKEGYTIENIAKAMHYNSDTIKKYLNPDFKVVDSHFDYRMQGGKLAPYREEVIELRSKGVTYVKIHEIISQKGYTGTVAALRVMMQKERMYAKFSEDKDSNEAIEYVQRTALCRILYTKLDDVTIISKSQYEAVLEKYPELKDLYDTVKEFKAILFSKHSEAIDKWMCSSGKLNIPEVGTFIEGLKRDLSAIRNGIENKYSNGLAEGSVNKIKVIKRIMYGRNSFDLLRNKTLLREMI